MIKSIQTACSAGLLALSISGCSIIEPMTKVEKVQPWEKGTLAKRQMALEGDAIDRYVDEHIYFSKEASTGGTGVGGGGCGCN